MLRSHFRVRGLVLGLLVVATLPAHAQNMQAPVAQDGTLACATGSVNAMVYLQYTDPDGGTIYSFTATSLPAHGTLQALSGGRDGGVGEGEWLPVAIDTPVSSQMWGYTPAPGYTGADSFLFKVHDGAFDSNVATVSITVTANTLPVASDQSVTVASGAVRYGIYLNLSDPDYSQPLTIVATSLPAHGTLEWADYASSQPGGGIGGEVTWYPIAVGSPVPSRSWAFTPAAGYTGPDSFSWKGSDGLAESGLATVSITINANTPPTAQDQSLSLIADAQRKSLGLRYSDPDMYQPLRFTAVTTPAHGVLEYSTWNSQTAQQEWHAITAGVEQTTASWTYTPNPGYVGGDSFTWKLSDGQAESSVATYTLTMTANTAPLALDMRKVVLAGETTTWPAAFVDPDPGQTRSLRITSTPSHGTLTTAGTSFSYTPAAGYTGTDSFSWVVNDGVVDSNPATLSLRVREVTSRAGLRVLVVVRATLAPEIAAELDQLEADLQADGYTAERLAWSGSGAEALWNDLRAAYLSGDSFLHGVILIGNLPMATNPTSNEPTDLVYWNMEKYRDTTRRHIWVSRIWALSSSGGALAAGSEVALIRRALAANHAYRSGASRLPHTVFFRDTFNNPGWSGSPDKALEIWPAVQIPQRLAPSFITGGELLHETEHGDASAYDRANPRVHVDSIQAIGAQTRFALCTSCGSGALGGVVNQQILTRDGGNVLSVGATRTTYAGAFVMLRTYGTDAKLRQRLTAGDAWGSALVDHYAFDDTQRAVFYGDLSFAVLRSPVNQMPMVSALTASATAGSAPLRVDLAVTAADPDGSIAGYEWFPEGHRLGRAEPLASGADRTALTHTFALPHRYLARVQVRDDHQAVAWKEVSIAVGPTPGQPLRVNCGSARLSANIYEEAKIHYQPERDLVDSSGELWLHDQPFAAGTWGATGTDRVDSVAQAVAGTEDDALYQSYRYADGSNTFTYKIPAASGGHTLILHFADMRSTAAGQRLTDVSVEGVPWLIGFDAFAEAGTRAAIHRSTHVVVDDGELSFTVSRNPVSEKEGFVSAFELIPDGAINQPPLAVASATPTAGPAPLGVQLSAAGSVDHDGSIVSYAWAFGDGQSGSGAQVDHTYTTPGLYTAQLTVTDDGGLSAVAQVTIAAEAAGNVPPVAVASATPSSGPAPLVVQLDGSGSSDSDGTIVAWVWDLGDGQGESGAQVSHTYLAPGSYQVVLTVTDSSGGQASNLVTVTVSAPLNRPPEAHIAADITSGWVPLRVELSGTGSSDSDGTIVDYAWDFGDGQVGAGAEVVHTFLTAGTYTVELTVTDDDGATGEASLVIEVGAAQNLPPVAHIVATPSSGNAPLLVNLDGRGSSDPDGSVVAWAWSFGDGLTGEGAQVVHTFAAAGRYTVRLTVTDDDGASASHTVAVDALDPGNDLPTAVLTATPTQGTAPLLVSLDGSGSSDADGSIVSYGWDLGDGTTGSGVALDHTYANPGTYHVLLTVTDDGGAIATASASIDVAAPANQPPTAVLDVTPDRGAAPLAVHCDGSGSSDPDGSIATYTLDFGDGQVGQGASADHTYALAGTYVVELMVTDDEGAFSRASRTVVVVAPGTDAGSSDANAADTGASDVVYADGGQPDAAAADTRRDDAVAHDVAIADTALLDRVQADLLAEDVRSVDASVQDGHAGTDAAQQARVGSGCACSGASGSAAQGSVALLVLGLALWRRRTRAGGRLGIACGLCGLLVLASCSDVALAPTGADGDAAELVEKPVAAALAWFGDTALPLDRREAAVHALARRGDEAARQRLQALGDAELYLNWAAVEALGAWPDPRVREYLESRLRHPDVHLACSAVRALARAAREHAIPALGAVLRESRSRDDGHGAMVRAAVVRALGDLGHPAALPFLVDELAHAGRDYRVDLDHGRGLVRAIERTPGRGRRAALLGYADTLTRTCPDEPLARRCYQQAAGEARAAAARVED